MDLRLSFNKAVDNYDLYRPHYPNQLFSDLINYAKLSSAHTALEIGIGTGKATADILKVGCAITAIELGDELTQYVKAKYSNYDQFEVMHDDFMNMTFENKMFDLIYSATAFHWLPQTEALTKIKHLLKPNGTVALFWNHPFPNREDDLSNVVNKSVYQKYRPTDKKIVEFSKADCQTYIQLLQDFGFKDVTCHLYHQKRILTSDEYVGLLNTYSDHIALPIDVKQAFELEMKQSLDEIGGMITIYDTVDLYLARV